MYSLQNKRQVNQTANPSKYPQGSFKDKPCRKCKTLFSPKAPSHLYCSDHCADSGLQDAYLKRNYGITFQDYMNMLEKQDHKCFLCSGSGFIMNKEKHKLKLVVDHCHKTGKVRRLLCHNCNRGLGLFRDDPSVLLKAVDYLKDSYE